MTEANAPFFSQKPVNLQASLSAIFTGLKLPNGHKSYYYKDF